MELWRLGKIPPTEMIEMSNEYADRPSIGKIIGYVVLCLVAVLALTWIFQGNDFFMYKYFAPRQVQVQREVFENSRAFNQGMVQELQNMQFEYVKEKDPQAKAALASVILHRASGYNMNDPIVPADLREFVEGLKQERTGSPKY